MNWYRKLSHILDPAEWVMVFLSWMIYLGGMVFFAGEGNDWAILALGALPVLVTAWSLGMAFGIGSALLSTSLHLLNHILAADQLSDIGTRLFQHLIGFTLLAITGMFAGHLRELQRQSQAELSALKENNRKLDRLSKALETTNRLTTDMATTREWMDRIPDLLKKVAAGADIDHLFLLQLTAEGVNHCSSRSYHYWTEFQTSYPEDDVTQIPSVLTVWIDSARKDIPVTKTLEELDDQVREYFYLQERGLFAFFPVFADRALWGFVGFESLADKHQWDSTELTTFQGIAQTLGALIYIKHVEDDLDLRARELDSLQKTSLNLASSDHLESGLHSVLSQIYELTPAYDTNIYLYRTNQLVFYLSLGRNGQQTLPYSHPGEEKISLLVAQSNQDYFISNLTAFDDIQGFSVDQEEALISLSLKAASEVIGVLNIWYPKARKFTREEKTILRLLADQAATAIVSMQFLQAEREQRILADSLRKANLQLSDNLELKDVLESILNQVLTLVSARDAQIFLYDGETLEFGAVIYGKGIEPDPVFPPRKESVFYKTALEGRRIQIPDIRSEKNLPENWKSGALVSLPLIFHHQVIGIMNVSFIKPGELEEGLLQVLDLLSNQAAIAINNARTFEAERKQRKLAQALQQTGHTIQSSLELEIVLDQILAQMASVINFDSANLILIENGTARLVRQIGYSGSGTAEIKPEQPRKIDISRFATLQRMTESNKPLIVPDTTRSADWIVTLTTKDVLSWAGAPILDGSQVIGFLSLNSRIRDFYSEDQAEILAAFADQAAIALRHASLHKEIQELAITDPLTKILNRRGLERWGQYEIDRAKRFNSSLAAIFFDLDHFKEINDTYGHEAGDVILQQVVSCCQAVIRKIDIFSRVGGEEFFIILPETPLPIAFHVAERIRKKVAGQEFQTNSHVVNITISLGVVELSGEIESLSELVNAADQHMYRAKQAGRNQTAYPTS
ncbi:MAG: diguanylate cyclase [Anaerolineales bacterium]